MNLLKTFTLPTDEPDTFLVLWTNSVIQPKGIIRVADQVLPPSDRSARMAWKKLVQLVSDSSLHEVSQRILWADANHSRSGRQEGRYFLSPRGKLILVITDTPNEGRRLVTTYPATQHFQQSTKPPK